MLKLNKSKCAQASMEYLIVVGFSLLLITPIVVIGNDSVVSLKRSSDNIAATDAVSRIADMADIVYAQGAPAKITEDVRFPSNIQVILIQDGIIDFRVGYDASTYNDIFEIVDYDVAGALTTNAGYHTVVVEAVAGGVSISEE